MTKINLRDYYPCYRYDFCIEVSNDLAELFKLFERKDHSDSERRRVHQAYYSLDADDGIERDILLVLMSPQDIYERKMDNKILYAAINSLPEKQAKRIYAHFFLGMSKTQIARIEGISKSAVSHSIKHGLKNLEKYLKNSF